MAGKQRAAQAVAAETVPHPESEYSMAEFAANSRTVFGVMPECVIAAFRVAGISKATKQAAHRIIKNFMEKEVR